MKLTLRKIAIFSGIKHALLGWIVKAHSFMLDAIISENEQNAASSA